MDAGIRAMTKKEEALRILEILDYQDGASFRKYMEENKDKPWRPQPYLYNSIMKKKGKK